MNKDTARAVLECIRNYCQEKDRLDKVVLEHGSGDILVDAMEYRIRNLVMHFKDLISFNT